MEAIQVGNFPDLQVSSGEGSVFIVDGDTTVYVSVQCAKKKLSFLHEIMRQVQSLNSWMPNFLPPTHSQNTIDCFLAVECFNKVPLINLSPVWYFRKSEVCPSKKEQWKAVSLYLTNRYKKLIWSIFKTVLAFVDTQIRPVLDVQKMFVSKDGNVIFSLYKMRDAVTHDRKFESEEIIKVLKYLVKSKARTSDTLKREFAELYNWMVSSTSPFHPQHPCVILPLLNNALTNVVFWDCRMRIIYMQLLGDFVIHDTVSIFPVAQHAFSDNSTNWPIIIDQCQIPVLIEVLALADDHYTSKREEFTAGSAAAPPSFLRNPMNPNFSDEEILRSGVLHIRDSYFHLYKMKTCGGLIVQYVKEDVSDEDLQAMYQYTFPSHIVKLAEVQHLIGFKAIDRILQSFSQTSVEDASAGLQ